MAIQDGEAVAYLRSFFPFPISLECLRLLLFRAGDDVKETATNWSVRRMSGTTRRERGKKSGREKKRSAAIKWLVQDSSIEKIRILI